MTARVCAARQTSASHATLSPAAPGLPPGSCQRSPLLPGGSQPGSAACSGNGGRVAVSGRGPAACGRAMDRSRRLQGAACGGRLAAGRGPLVWPRLCQPVGGGQRGWGLPLERGAWGERPLGTPGPRRAPSPSSSSPSSSSLSAERGGTGMRSFSQVRLLVSLFTLPQPLKREHIGLKTQCAERLMKGLADLLSKLTSSLCEGFCCEQALLTPFTRISPTGK